jgi:hypothetical protein
MPPTQIQNEYLLHPLGVFGVEFCFEYCCTAHFSVKVYKRERNYFAWVLRQERSLVEIVKASRNDTTVGTIESTNNLPMSHLLTFL